LVGKSGLLIPGEIASIYLSILLLGELRASDAVDVLLANLTYENPKELLTFGGSRSPAFRYPAVEALIKIGRPAFYKTLAVLKKAEDELTRELCGWVLMGIGVTEGKKKRGIKVKVLVSMLGSEDLTGLRGNR